MEQCNKFFIVQEMQNVKCEGKTMGSVVVKLKTPMHSKKNAIYLQKKISFGTNQLLCLLNIYDLHESKGKKKLF